MKCNTSVCQNLQNFLVKVHCFFSAEMRCEREERSVLSQISEDQQTTEEEVNVSSCPLMSLSTGIKLLSLRDADKHEKR